MQRFIVYGILLFGEYDIIENRNSDIYDNDGYGRRFPWPEQGSTTRKACTFQAG
jgi:hypothetical protein